MTFEQFAIWSHEMSVIVELESGEKKVTGKDAVAMAMNDPAIRKK